DRGRKLAETLLDHLDGYGGSRPVRIGNGAAEQLQLDIYGEVLVSAHLHFHARVPDDRAPDEDAAPGGGPSADTCALLRAFGEEAAARGQEKDAGIWGVRGGPRPFLSSKLMCGAAVARGIALAREWGLDAPLQRWRKCRAEIRRAILEQGFNGEVGAFTQSFGS